MTKRARSASPAPALRAPSAQRVSGLSPATEKSGTLGAQVAATINGQVIRVPLGTTILEAARRLDIRIPTLCFHEDLCVAGICRICVVEVEEIVPAGSLDPDHVHLPGIYVHRLIQGQHEKRIEQRTVRKRPEAAAATNGGNA